MDIEIFPMIAPNDYAAFRQLLGEHIPDAYDEWRQLQAKEIREFTQVGGRTLEVPINSHEFSRFLTARGANANLVSLRNCVIEKDAGNAY
jgi:hypothetical protein